MPGDKTAVHPSGLKLNFTEDDHRYVDELGREYTSVTTLLHDFFPKFDAEKTAAKKARETGRAAEEFIREWEENSRRACAFGTRIHENCENQMLGMFDRMHQPRDSKEQQYFAIGWNTVEMLKTAFRFYAAEMIVFSPRFRIAGSIDLQMLGQSSELHIFDYKSNKEIKRKAFQGQSGTQYPTRKIQNCEFEIYALQLALYEALLKIEGYIAPELPVFRSILWFDPGAEYAQKIDLPSRELEVSQIIMFHHSRGFDEIPF